MKHPFCPDGFSLVEFLSTVEVWEDAKPGQYRRFIGAFPKPYSPQDLEWWKVQVAQIIEKGTPRA